jgi:hypothetical protein
MISNEEKEGRNVKAVTFKLDDPLHNLDSTRFCNSLWHPALFRTALLTRPVARKIPHPALEHLHAAVLRRDGYGGTKKLAGGENR